jgi:hypothetical protein
LILCPYLAKNSSSPRVIHLLSFIYNPKRHIEYVFIANLIANLFTLGLFYRYFIKVKLKLSFAIISISGVYALKTYLQGSLTRMDMLWTVGVHVLFVVSAVGMAYAEYIAKKHHT